jgi:Flp pilus assembly protein TadG
MSAHRERRTPMLRSDEGAVIVEAALVLPLIVMLVLATLEFGFLHQDANQLERSVQTAARVGASMATNGFADYEALRSLDSSLSKLHEATVKKVIIYRASTPNGNVPAACLTASTTPPLAAHGVSTGTTRCNVYVTDQVKAANPNTGFPSTSSTRPSCTGGWDVNWCPSSRRRNIPADYLGVWVQIEYKPVTSLFNRSTITVARKAVFQVEPCAAGDPACS